MLNKSTAIKNKFTPKNILAVVLPLLLIILITVLAVHYKSEPKQQFASVNNITEQTSFETTTAGLSESYLANNKETEQNIGLSSLLNSPIVTFAANNSLSDYISPIDTVAAKNSDIIYVADQTKGKIYAVNPITNKNIKEFSFDDVVNGLCLSSDDSKLYVTIGKPDGKLLIVNTSTAEVTNTINVGHTPQSPVLSSDGNTLYVLNRFSDEVEIIDLVTKTSVKKVKTTKEPMSAVLSNDGKKLFVANHIPAGTSNTNNSSADISVLNTTTRVIDKNIPLSNGAIDAKDICISPDGRYAYVSSIIARYTYPTSQLDRAWQNTNAVAIIDVNNSSYLTSVLLDDVDLGASSPWGIACTSDGKSLIAAISGTHQIIVIDREAMMTRINNVISGSYKIPDIVNALTDVPNAIPFLRDLKYRINIPGNGPRGIAVKGDYVYTAQYFSGDLGVAYLPAKTSYAVKLGSQPEMDSVRKGEMLWNDGTLCYQFWQNCASCHPDGRADSLNWDNLNDGLGNPKNTKSMLLAHDTPPAMITGIRADAETAVRAGMKYIQFNTMTEDTIQSIDNYLKSMKAEQSPYLNVDGSLTDSAKRGQILFESDDVGCAKCHPAPLYTNQKMYDVGTINNQTDGYENRPFDTPTLVEVWRTGPWLYNGKAATMMDVLTTYNQNDEHGKTSHLNQQELKDLEEFVLSIGTTFNSSTVDKSVLEALITSVETDLLPIESAYTVDSFKALKTNLEKAKNLIKLSDVTQEQIDSEVTSLNQAIDNLAFLKFIINAQIDKYPAIINELVTFQIHTLSSVNNIAFFSENGTPAAKLSTNCVEENGYKTWYITTVFPTQRLFNVYIYFKTDLISTFANSNVPVSVYTVKKIVDIPKIIEVTPPELSSYKTAAPITIKIRTNAASLSPALFNDGGNAILKTSEIIEIDGNEKIFTITFSLPTKGARNVNIAVRDKNIIYPATHSFVVNIVK